MNEKDALKMMVPPGARRRGKWRGGVIQIHVTRACDKACPNCTQGSNFKGPFTYITPENFEKAVKSLEAYFGVVGIFGGNPAMHPQFEELCGILRDYIPFEQRGLWSNNPLGKGQAMRQTFNPAVSNLNVHLDEKAYHEFKQDWPESAPFGLEEDSRHSPVFVAMNEVIKDPSTRWGLIANCDINKHWSAMVCQVRGEAKAYFCEIAGAQAMLHENDEGWPDTGIDPTPGWWERPMADFAAQVNLHCHLCSVPLRGYGDLACNPNAVNQVSNAHASFAVPKKKQHTVQITSSLTELRSKNLRFTEYVQGAKK